MNKVTVIKVKSEANFRKYDYAVQVNGRTIYQTGSAAEAQFIYASARKANA